MGMIRKVFDISCYLLGMFLLMVFAVKMFAQVFGYVVIDIIEVADAVMGLILVSPLDFPTNKRN